MPLPRPASGPELQFLVLIANSLNAQYVVANSGTDATVASLPRAVGREEKGTFQLIGGAEKPGLQRQGLGGP